MVEGQTVVVTANNSEHNLQFWQKQFRITKEYEELWSITVPPLNVLDT